MRALDDLAVVEIGHVYNGPYCGLLFAHLGATVIKVEPPGGDPVRFRSSPVSTHEFVMLNSSKRSVELDLKSERDRADFFALLERADVLIENFGPGVMTRLGLDVDELHERFPRLVIATGKGFGSSGPYASMPAMDLTIQAMSGAMASTGFPDGPPTKAGPAFADFLGGAHLFAGALAAIHERDRTGAGQVVEVSIHDTIYPALASVFGAMFNAGPTPPARNGNRHSGGALSPYNAYRAADGFVGILAMSQGHFRGLAEAMGRPDLIDDPRFVTGIDRVAHMDEIDEVVQAWTAERTRWEIVDVLRAAGVPAAPVLEPHEVVDDPHLRDRGMVLEVDHPVRGRVLVPGSPIRLGPEPVPDVVAAPELGVDTQIVRDAIATGARLGAFDFAERTQS